VRSPAAALETLAQRQDAPSGTDTHSDMTSNLAKGSSPSEQVVPVPDSSTPSSLPLPSQPIQMSAQGDKRDAAGAATDMRKTFPAPTRPTTGGKSMETVENLLGKRFRVNLKVTKKGKEQEEQEEQDEEQDDVPEEEADGSHNGSDWEPEKQPRNSSTTKPKNKKRRVVSAARVDSDGDDNPPHEPGWPVVPSRRSCDACSEDGWFCMVFDAQPRGRQRYACQRCKSLKKGCSRSDARKKELARIIAMRRANRRNKKKDSDDNEDDDEEEDEEGEDEDDNVEKVDSRKRKRSKSGERSRSRKDEVRKKQRRAESGGGGGERRKERNAERQKQRQKAQETQRRKEKSKDEKMGNDSSKGKGKGKGKQKADTDDEDELMAVDTTDLILKEERDEDVQWTTGKYFIFLHYFHII